MKFFFFFPHSMKKNQCHLNKDSEHLSAKRSHNEENKKGIPRQGRVKKIHNFRLDFNIHRVVETKKIAVAEEEKFRVLEDTHGGAGSVDLSRGGGKKEEGKKKQDKKEGRRGGTLRVKRRRNKEKNPKVEYKGDSVHLLRVPGGRDMARVAYRVIKASGIVFWRQLLHPPSPPWAPRTVTFSSSSSSFSAGSSSFCFFFSLN